MRGGSRKKDVTYRYYRVYMLKKLHLPLFSFIPVFLVDLEWLSKMSFVLYKVKACGQMPKAQQYGVWSEGVTSKMMYHNFLS